MTSTQELLKALNSIDNDEFLYMSPQGLEKLTKIFDPSNPSKHIQWETDYSLELPVRMKKKGYGSEPALTLIDVFKNVVTNKPNQEALKVKRDGVWIAHTFQQFYDDCVYFANACISLGLQEMRSVNIMGFNSPEWAIAFYGSIFGHYLPVGIYTTNGPEACHYVSSHSDAELIVVENQEILDKYLQIWKDLPLLKNIVIYGYKQELSLKVPEEYKSRVLIWRDFLNLGKAFKPNKLDDQLEYRMSQQKPGNCCTLVYTSGTTGLPKAVMLSHDNYTWTCQQSLQQYNNMFGNQEDERIVSYLPLSHVAAQLSDIIGCISSALTVWFAEPTALQGTLVNTLQEARPTFFFGVPRVWEKIEEKMKFIAQSNGFVKKSIADWAKNQGKEGTFEEINNKNTTFCFSLAKKIVYNNVKKALGLDQARVLMTGAAPLQTSTRDYFLSLNMFIVNAYGMSESSGPQTMTDPRDFKAFDKAFLKSAGGKIFGTDIKIVNPDKDGNGEICYKGRNRFMGYYKNDKATQETIDQDGYLHSGDVGQLDAKGNLTITGRLKELIITAGGENIAPVLIENEIKIQLPFLSQAMIVGEQRKYLVALLTLKMEPDTKGQPSSVLSNESIKMFESMGLGTFKTVADLKKNNEFLKLVEEGINQANKKAISKAHYIRKWYILEQDFSVDGGELTPTLKLKRSVTIKKYNQIIENLYLDANL